MVGNSMMCFNKTPLTALPLKLASLPIKLLINLRNVPALHFAPTVMKPLNFRAAPGLVNPLSEGAFSFLIITFFIWEARSRAVMANL